MKKKNVASMFFMTLMLVSCGGGTSSVSSSSGNWSSSSNHHHLYQTLFTEPTCTERGYATYACSCGESYVDDYVDALGHDLTHHEAKEPTCTEVGWEVYDDCSRCDYSTYDEIPALGHDFVDYEAKEPTCGETGWEAYGICSTCGYSSYEEIPATYEHEYIGGVCTACGGIVPDGEIVEFGNYPQTVVTDESLISTLSAIDDADGDGYIEHEGTEYLKTFGSGNNGYSVSTTYYFVVEPITWKFYGGMLIADKVIDASVYYTRTSTRSYGESTISQNNYTYSTIRAYLNGLDGSDYEVDNFSNNGFIDEAFTEAELGMIKATTDDKIFLLSYEDAINEDYGYSAQRYDFDSARVRKYTDYSLFRGLEYFTSSSGAGYWWLSSRGLDLSNFVSSVRSDGLIGSGSVTLCLGISPALNMNVQEPAS